MPKSPSAVEVPLKDIFSSNYLFNIPGYQRPYAWTRVESEELFDDLWGFLEANPEPNPNDSRALEEASTYFLGSIVLIKEKDRPEATVVDGQQRLTTLTLLLACIRSTLNDKSAEQLNGFIYEPGNEYRRLPDRFRLQLRSTDAEFFKTYVQQPSPGILGMLKMDTANKTIDTDAKRNIRLNAENAYG